MISTTFLLVGGILLIGIGGVLLRHGFSLWAAPDEAFRAAKNSAPASSAEALSGDFDPYSRHRRDYAVSAGLASKTDGTLIPQGRLSDEMVNRIS